MLTALMMTFMLALVAFSVDLGYLNIAQTELQRTADAAAIAGTWELMDENALYGGEGGDYARYLARWTAMDYAQANPVTTNSPELAWDDLTVGYLANPLDPSSQIDPCSPLMANAVEVRVRRTSDLNGEVPMFFARALGFDSRAAEATATAAMLTNIIGFKPPSNGENLDVLPFALDQETWNDLMAGVGDDDWRWDPETKDVVPGSDGILEVNLFPQGTGSPGNRGTVDIGPSNNSTADLRRQIETGITAEDLAYIGGSLELDENGQLFLNGDTGISAGMKDALASIIGKQRTILIFSDVSGPGNNAEYTIVAFVGVRLLDVKLTGSMSSKRVMIQPAIVVTKGAIPAPEGWGQTSHFVYSPVWLVR